jgi:MOSC domain-containing protein YiiM
MMEDPPRIVSVNVGRSTELTIDGRRVPSAIGKRRVVGPVDVRLLGLAGDEQADRRVHGGVSKAVYAYPVEHYPVWRTVRAQARAAAREAAMPHGLLGENLTVWGLTEDRVWIGDRLRLPGCVLAVSAPRRPCFKLDAALGFEHAGKMMLQSGYCGYYLGVIEPGVVQAGDPIELIPGPRDVNVRELFRARRTRR